MRSLQLQHVGPNEGLNLGLLCWEQSLSHWITQGSSLSFLLIFRGKKKNLTFKRKKQNITAELSCLLMFISYKHLILINLFLAYQ